MGMICSLARGWKNAEEAKRIPWRIVRAGNLLVRYSKTVSLSPYVWMGRWVEWVLGIVFSLVPRMITDWRRGSLRYGPF